ncbi:prepilin-type N-terminal cleavage/methylation domain-containing protein [Candidatus Kaiserbacteria bacterium]|nr:prepilin-type N-terminal cleavage/methylation domain-containing protein [Candidatus Kaiserbacteria bacterium]
MRGFTLIETIVYIGLLAVLMSAAIVATFQLIDSGAHNETAVAIQEEGTFLERKIGWALTGATSVSALSNTLTITRLASSSFPDTDNPLTISVNGTSLILQRSVYTPVALNSAAFAVTSFTATVDTSQMPAKVDVSFSVQTIGTPTQSAAFTYRSYLR